MQRARLAPFFMTLILFFEQLLNGVQLGVMLFLMAAGLTLVLGIMNLVNLAHGSLYMVGAYLTIAAAQWTGSYWLGVLLGLAGALVVGMIVEVVTLRALYARDHLDQVLATFGLILFFNELVAMIWGRASLYSSLPAWLQGHVELLPGSIYPVYRLVIIAVGLAVAALLWYVVTRTRLGMLIRAGASNRTMVAALGVNIRLLYTVVFGFGAALAGLAGLMAGPIYSVQPGMGELILIQVFVVIVIGGIGSIRGALVGALIVGIVDTLGRAFLKPLLGSVISPPAAEAAGPALASMLIYLLMAVVLAVRPAGLFPARG
jgi:branched-chain amino acid transport system permease protein